MIRHLTFTAFNRVEYLNTTIKSWNNVRNLGNWAAYFCIEPSNVQDEIIRETSNLHTVVNYQVNAEKLGVLVNPWQAVNNRFIAGAEFVVLAEDDVVVSEDSLEFMQWASIKYLPDPQVLAINLFSQHGIGEERDVVKCRGFSPLVWGIWKDRWEKFLRDTWDKDYSSGNADGSEAGWDWNINRIIRNNDLVTIQPTHSRSDHIGKHNGTHMTPAFYESSRGSEFVKCRSPQNYREI